MWRPSGRAAPFAQLLGPEAVEMRCLDTRTWRSSWPGSMAGGMDHGGIHDVRVLFTPVEIRTQLCATGRSVKHRASQHHDMLHLHSIHKECLAIKRAPALPEDSPRICWVGTIHAGGEIWRSFVSGQMHPASGICIELSSGRGLFHLHRDLMIPGGIACSQSTVCSCILTGSSSIYT